MKLQGHQAQASAESHGNLQATVAAAAGMKAGREALTSADEGSSDDVKGWPCVEGRENRDDNKREIRIRTRTLGRFTHIFLLLF